MRKIKKTLTHKVGPFAVWVWALAVLAGVVILRRRQQRAQQGSEQPRNDRSYASAIQQPDLAFVPGGEIPVSPDMSSPSGGDSSGLLDLLAQIIAQRNSPSGQTETSAAKNPGSGAKKPSKPRKPKPKPHHERWPHGKRTTKHPPKPNPRSGSGWQHLRGHKPDPHKGSSTQVWAGKHRANQTGAKSLPPLVRQRPKVPLVGRQPQPTQRPPASHTKVKDTPRPAPRPSSPPKRTMRTLRKGY